MSVARDEPCQQVGCDCERFEPSRLALPRFLGRCVQCRHGHNDADDVLHAQAAATDGQPCAITPRLFVSNIVAATNVKMLRADGITHIVNCCPGAFRGAGGALNCRALGPEDGFTRIDLDGFEDSGGQNVAQHGAASHEFIASALAASPDNKVLVHCAQGVSRSSSMCVYHLMAANGISYDEALALVKTARPLCQPNTSFEAQLRDVERQWTRERKEKEKE